MCSSHVAPRLLRPRITASNQPTLRGARADRRPGRVLPSACLDVVSSAAVSSGPARERELATCVAVLRAATPARAASVVHGGVHAAISAYRDATRPGLDHFLAVRATPPTFFMSEGWMYGPFFVDRDIGYLRPLPRRRTMNLSVRLLLRVR